MEANLLYIHENDLSPAFQSKLCSFNGSTIPLYIIVQLKETPKGFEPLINNLKDIRIEKATKKINNWLQICFDLNQPLIVKMNDEDSSLIRVNIDLSKINKLSAYCAQRDSKAVLSYIQRQFSGKDYEIGYF